MRYWSAMKQDWVELDTWGRVDRVSSREQVVKQLEQAKAAVRQLEEKLRSFDTPLLDCYFCDGKGSYTWEHPHNGSECSVKCHCIKWRG